MGLANAGELIGLLHDLGKFSGEFQAYLRSALGLLDPDLDDEFVDAKGRKGKVDHSSAGAQWVWRELSQAGQIGQVGGQVLAVCLASHHSGMIDCLTSDLGSFGEDAFGKRMGKPDKFTHFQEVQTRADEAILDRAKTLVAEPETLEGIRQAIARILRSNPGERDRGAIVQQQVGLLARFLFSCLLDADRIDTADAENPRRAKLRQRGDYSAWPILVDRLERHLRDLRPERPIDRVRGEVSDHCLAKASSGKGIYTLTVPTGGGKTLASLRFALHHADRHGMDRVIYVIPFTTIIDQNAEIVRTILEPEGTAPGEVLLEHHSNLTPEKQTWRAKILSENWDAPVVYTTSVQLLETLFGAGTRGARRMHQLANAVLVFDEIQTLPVNCVHLFNNAVNFLVEQCGSTVVLCTATQPLLDKVDRRKGALRIPDENEIMPDVGRLFADLKRVEIVNSRKTGGWSLEEVGRLALKRVEEAGSCLVVVNTKDAARSIARQCAQEGGSPVHHLSTAMCPAHRKAVLAEVRRRLEDGKPTLCVSTQLIEAGVDVDFGSVIRFTAGLDSIAQAAGRCNRNQKTAVGYVHVVNPRPEDENLDKLPDIRIGREAAERVLDDFEADPAKFDKDRIGPKAMAWYYLNYFFDRAKDMDYPVPATVLGHDDTLLELLSRNSQAQAEYVRIRDRAPGLYLRQSFMAAAKAFKSIDAPTEGVIVPHGEEGREVIGKLCSAFLPDQERELLRRAQQVTVNVFPHVLEWLTREELVRETQPGTGILYLIDHRYYSPLFGLGTTPEGTMEDWNV